MRRFSPWSDSVLEKKFIRTFLPALVIVLLMACAACLGITWQQLAQMLQNYGEQAAVFATRTLHSTPPENEAAANRQLVDDLAKDPAIAGVRLTDEKTGVKWAEGRIADGPAKGAPKLTKDVVIDRKPPASPTHFRLEIWMTPPSFPAILQESWGQMMVLGTFASFAFFLGLSLHRHLIGRPLRSFHEAIASQEGGRDRLEAPTTEDELGTALQAYQTLSRHRLETQKELIVSQERLRILSDNLPNAFLYQNRVNPNGEITFSFVGESVREVLGVTPEEVYRDPGLLRNKIDPDYMTEMLEVEGRAVRKRAEFFYECPYLFPDGSRHWVQMLSRPSQMPDGEYLWQGVFIDVSETREKDAALQQSRADARAILSALPDPIFVNPWPARREGVHFTHVNPSACEFLGMTEDELLAVGPREVDELSAEEIQRIRSALQSDGHLRFETTFVRKDGRRFPGEICACLIEFGGRTVSVSVARSLEEQKKRENEIREASAQIEADRALIAQKNIELNQLLHVLCHDLANPISVLNGMLNLRKAAPNNDLAECAEISQQVLDLIGLVHKLQGFEASKRSLALENVPADFLIEQAIRTVFPRLEAKHLQLSRDFAPDLRIQVEPVSFLNSVLANILTNAIKFSLPHGRIQIRTRIADGKALIECQDDGIGIPPDLLNRIFVPSERTTRPGTAGEIGTGFGMPLVKRFVEWYGGKIEISSTPLRPGEDESSSDHGTRVRLILPLAERDPS